MSNDLGMSTLLVPSQINPVFWGVIFGFSILLSGYYVLCQEVKKRQMAEIVLRQQTERERVVTQIAHHIRQSLNLEEVLVTTVAEVRQFLICDRVLIYRLWEDGTGSAITETVLPDLPMILGQSFPEEVFPREFHQAYTQGKILAITDLEQEQVESCLIEFLQQFKVKAKLVVPILQGENLWGLLIAHHCNQPRQWQALEIELMKQLATQVAIAIQQSELYEQLQELNSELENRVQERTEELGRANSSLREEIAVRQQTEASLRHINQTLQSLITASPRAIFTLDLTGKIKLWNPAAERMFGWTEAEVIDTPNPIVPDDKVQEYNALRQSVLQGATPPSVEWRHQKKDGTPIDISFSAAPLSDREGNISGLVAVVADITQRKRLDEVRLALEREKELSALKIRFFSMASHEFRTPLSTILAASQILETCGNEAAEQEKRSRNLKRIQSSIKNMIQLLDDILTINRAETGKLEFNPKLLDLENFCLNFIDELRLSAGNQHTITFSCLEHCGNAYLDEKLLRSILANLLSNAIKYSPEGGNVTLTLRREQNNAIFQIKDRGIGISPTDQKRLFEPFNRGKNVRNIPGTGLGLVVVKKCVDLQGGNISVNSVVRDGTTITVTLPLRQLNS
jgi:PAS domain S-box-containing protein